MKHIIRMAPCAAYDIAGMQLWLEEMAKKGYLLEKDGFLGHFAAFTVGEPRFVKYRLEAAPKSTGMFSENGGEPDDEQVALGAEFDWTYIAKRGEFYIFRSESGNGREMHTDPAVHALALNAVKNRQIWSVVFLCLYIALLGWRMARAGWISALLQMGTGLALLIALLMLLWLADSSAALHATRRAQQSLRTEGVLPSPGNRRRATVRYFAGGGLRFLTVILLIVTVLNAFTDWAFDKNRHALSEAAAPFPFATIAELVSGEITAYDPQMQGMDGRFNSYETHSDFLARCVTDYNEHAKVTLASGETVDASLYVDYVQMRSAWTAHELAREWLHTAQRNKHYREIPFSADADFTAAYLNNLHFPELIVQKGCVAARISFHKFNAETQSAEIWMPIAVALLK